VRSRGGGVQPRGHPPTCQRTHALPMSYRWPHALPATRAACGPSLRQRVWRLAAGPARGDARGGDNAALAGPAHRGSACDVRRGIQWEPRMDTEGLQREQSQGGHARPLTVEQQIYRPCPGGGSAAYRRGRAQCPSCSSWPTAPLAVLPGPWRRPRTPGERGSSGRSPRSTGRGLDAASGAPAALRGQWRRSSRRRESRGGAADGPRLRRSARRDVGVMRQWLNGPAPSFFILRSLSASASAH